MTYTPQSGHQLRSKKGTLSAKLGAEFGLVGAEVTLHKRKFMMLTPVTGTNTSFATSGVDLASGSDVTLYGFFFPKAAVLVKMHDVLTEAYVKDTVDAAIKVYADLVGGADLLFTRTMTAAGETVRTAHATSPEAGASAIAAGTMVYLQTTHTDAASGTGHALVAIEFYEA